MIHKTTRSILSVLLAALLLVTSIPLTPAFADGGAVSPQSESGEGGELAGNGTKDNPYQIATADDLLEFAKLVNGGKTDADAVLTADIDLSEICGEEFDSSWTPIGNSSINQYRGTFDGAGHTISGLYIKNTSSDTDYQGLFGYVSGSGEIEYLTVSGSVSVTGGNSVGGVVGSNSGTVENCYNTGTVTGTGTDDYVGGVGGVVGYNGGPVENCYNTGKVTGSAASSNVGGVVGRNDGTVKNCYNTGAVSGGVDVGGVVGYNSGTVENCYNTGAVSGGEDVGGVVGDSSGGSSASTSVTNCYNTGTVTGNSFVGGVVGYNISSTVKNCYNTGAVNSSGKWVGGVVGDNDDASVTNCYFLKGTAEKGIGSDTSEPDETAVDDLNELCQKFASDPWTISDTLKRPVLKDNHEDDGSKDHPYEIFTATQLKTFRDLVNGEGDQAADTDAHAKLMNNIYLSSVCSAEEGSWAPIGNSESTAYTGNFNGQNFKISGLYIKNTSSDNDYQGLFGFVGRSGKVQNLSVSGSVSGDISGGVVGGNGGTVKNCYNTGNISGNNSGGVVGYNGGTVENCHNIGDVSGPVTGTDNYVGGVVGGNSGSVTNCYNIGDVSYGAYTGGVVGWNDSGTVKNCYNTGSVTVTGSDGRVGGVVGYNSSTVENCYNTGTVSGSGGHVGGVVGDNRGTVKNCYNTGEVSGPDSGNSVISNVGGVVGYISSSSTVENCYNTGNVSVKSSDISNVGGVVGYNDSSSTVENCYNTGNVSVTSSDISSVSGDWYVGGVVGYNDGDSVANCYYLQQNGVPAQGIGGGSGTSSNVEARTADAFQSGEVAYLLQSKQTDESGLVWGQNLMNEPKDNYPQLRAFDADTPQVYKVAFMNDSEEHDAKYANSSMTVTIPAAPSREGHTFTGWSDGTSTYQAGAKVEITSDTKFTAQWTKDTVNYTVTVTASPAEGGTVNGGGTFTENDSVTVSATPASGYTFVEWQEDGEKIENAAATYTFELTGNRNLTAIFEKDEDPTPTPTPDPEPTGPSTGDSTGWDDIRDELENAENGDEITIDMGDETKVPAEIFESLAGKDVEISFDLGDIQWTVNGADIPTDTDFTDLDLGASLGTSGIPVNVINTITGEVGTVQITLAHDGEFGFTMTLTAPLGKENAGYWANLYHYDEDAEALNFETAAEIDADGSVTIPFSHASQYAIVIDTHSHATVDVSDIFIDVAPNAWYKDAVQYAYDNGLMTGVSATEFAPEATTTRAMIVSILARLEGVTTAQAAGFADVDDNDWYATAVNWAANVGVVNGYEDNTFRPNTAITREQLAAILMNYAAYKGYDVSARADLSHYSDADSISSWANDVLLWAVAEGLLTGVTDDTIAPQAHATRAQVAAILQRFLSE